MAAGEYERVGTYMMRERLVEPVRAARLPFYDRVRDAALAAGAWACAITGSGPAMFALVPTQGAAEKVAAAMVAATRAVGIPAIGVATQPDARGVRVI